MTLWISREPGTTDFLLQVTHGPVTIVVQEGEASLRHLWGELGKLLEDQAPAAAAAEDGDPGEPGEPGQAPGFGPEEGF